MTAFSSGYILALDLGTTGNRAFLFDGSGQVVSHAYKELTQHYPQPGWLEHDPEQIWRDTCRVLLLFMGLILVVAKLILCSWSHFSVQFRSV